MRVQFEKPPETAPEADTPELHRKVAEWFLKRQLRIGLERGGWVTRMDALPPGNVKVTAINADLTNPDDLPPKMGEWLKTIRPVEVGFHLRTKEWNDEKLAALVRLRAGVPNLHLFFGLETSVLAISDKGIRHLLMLPNLKGIQIYNLNVSDEAIRSLQKLEGS